MKSKKKSESKKDQVREYMDARWLDEELTGNEVENAARELAFQTGRKTELEEEKKVFNGKIGAEIKGVQEQIDKLGGMVRSGKVRRKVDVKVEVNYTKGTMKVTRKSDGGVVEERKLEGEELQQTLT